jgi:hypothetical protein
MFISVILSAAPPRLFQSRDPRARSRRTPRIFLLFMLHQGVLTIPHHAGVKVRRGAQQSDKKSNSIAERQKKQRQARERRLRPSPSSHGPAPRIVEEARTAGTSEGLTKGAVPYEEINGVDGTRATNSHKPSWRLTNSFTTPGPYIQVKCLSLSS